MLDLAPLLLDINNHCGGSTTGQGRHLHPGSCSVVRGHEQSQGLQTLVGHLAHILDVTTGGHKQSPVAGGILATSSDCAKIFYRKKNR